MICSSGAHAAYGFQALKASLLSFAAIFVALPNLRDEGCISGAVLIDLLEQLHPVDFAVINLQTLLRRRSLASARCRCCKIASESFEKRQDLIQKLPETRMLMQMVVVAGDELWKALNGTRHQSQKFVVVRRHESVKGIANKRQTRMPWVWCFQNRCVVLMSPSGQKLPDELPCQRRGCDNAVRRSARGMEASSAE